MLTDKVQKELERLKIQFSTKKGYILKGIFFVFSYNSQCKVRLGTVREYKRFQELLQLEEKDLENRKKTQSKKWEEILPNSYDCHYYAGEFEYKRKN